MQDIYVGDVGKEFPLVLVYGFLGSSIMWGPQIGYFKESYRVIIIDLPGYGNSKKAQSKNNINEMARTVLDCLKEKNIDSFFLLGHSRGGMMVQEMTKLTGEKIDKLICYGTGVVGNIPGRFESMNESRNRLKKDGLDSTAYRIAKTWFIEENKSKYFNQINILNKNISNNELSIFKNCSHNLDLEKPEEFNKCIDKFLNNLFFN